VLGLVVLLLVVGSHGVFLEVACWPSVVEPVVGLGEDGFVRKDISMSDDGSAFVFVSQFDPSGTNPNGKSEVFHYDIDADRLTQVTMTPDGGPASGSVGDAAISGDGETIVFASFGDYTGDNPDGSGELFLISAPPPEGVIWLRRYRQLTFTDRSFGIGGLDINEDGSRIAFLTRPDLTGENSEHGENVFLYETTRFGGFFNQITDERDLSGLDHEVFPPKINADGTKIVFASNQVDTGYRTDRSRALYLYDHVTGATRQLTDDVGPISRD
jgi:Tol biopolymer transport system component